MWYNGDAACVAVKNCGLLPAVSLFNYQAERKIRLHCRENGVSSRPSPIDTTSGSELGQVCGDPANQITTREKGE